MVIVTVALARGNTLSPSDVDLASVRLALGVTVVVDLHLLGSGSGRDQCSEHGGSREMHLEACYTSASC